MGNFLHKLGNYAFTHKWQVVSIWVVVMALLGSLAAMNMKPTSNAISIPGTQAQKAIDRMAELFPDAGKGSGRIVVASPEGKTVADFTPQITSLADEVKKVDGVSAAISPFENASAISEDKTIAYVQVQLKNENGSVPTETTEAIERLVSSARANNLTVEVGGDIINKAPGEILGIGEAAGVLLALLVLAMTLGSLLSAGMPIVTALVAVGVSMAGLFSLGQVIDISATTPVLAVMLGLAVGIDYSLFIISKYRSYLLEGYGYKEAAGKSIATAGNAVIFAAATVVIALSALTIVQIPFMSTMGLAGAATIAVAAVVAVTLVPALLGFAGSRIFRGKTKIAIEKAQARGPRDAHTVSHKTIWYRWGEAITRRPITILVAAIVLIGIVALPVGKLHLGLPTDEHAATSSTERKAYDLLSRGFGAGFNGPLLVVVEGLPAVSESDKEAIRAPLIAQMNQKIAEQQASFAQRAASVTTMEEAALLQQDIAAAQSTAESKKAAAEAQIEGAVSQYAKYNQLKKIADKLTDNQDIAQVQPALVTDDGTKGALQVIPRSSPSDQKTLDLIEYLRAPDTMKNLSGSDTVSFAVTGSTALQGDINAKLSSALPEYLAVVVGLSLVLLVVAFRSILVPIKATLGFLLSVLAMFGAMVAVFQWGWFGIADAPGPIVSFIPIIAIGILFGLAMDYEFFLVSSMHEAYQRTGDAKKAVISGFGLGSKVVAAAGAIMVAIFAGFITNHDATIQTIGFGLAVGILIDAFVVRMTIVPAVMTLLGKSAWWLPKWLDRIVPHISIEGEETSPKSKK